MFELNSDNADPDTNYFHLLRYKQDTFKYKSYDEYEKNLLDIPNPLNIITLNIRSFHANADSFLSNFCSKTLPSIFVFSETWFTHETTAGKIPNYKEYHTIRHGKSSGGVSIYAKNNLKSRIFSEYSYCNENIELCCVNVTEGNLDLLILGVYRPVSGDINLFLLHLETIFTDLSSRSKKIMILGDMNLDMLKNNSNTCSYTELMHSYHFQCLVSKPTRFPTRYGDQASLLDHVWINEFNYSNGGILLDTTTDHLPLYIVISLDKSINTDERVLISFRENSDFNKISFSNALCSINWNEYKSTDADIYFNNFVNLLNSLYCKHFPLKSKSISKNHSLNPWMNADLRKLIKIKSKIFHLYKIGIVSLAEKNTLRNRINSIIKKTKNKYYSNLLENNRGNQKKTWQIIRGLSSIGTKDNSIPRIIHEGIELTNPSVIADFFNNYFCSINNELNSDTSNDLYIPNIEPLSSSIFLNPVTSTECEKLISNLKNTGQSVNCIPVSLIKYISPIISPILSDIINCCFSCGVFPDNLKIATVIPIYKKGDKNSVSNYRPISLLPVFSKIFEKCIQIRIQNFLFQNSVFSKFQFGFLPKRSTFDAVSSLVEKLYEGLNFNKISIGIFVDFKKAFDSVNHRILMRKLNLLGIRGTAYNLIHSYLSDRYQCVKIEDNFSSKLILNNGIPQGSVLGPLLFIIFINDLPNISNLFSTLLFADDTTFHLHDNNLENLVFKCNTCLQKFSEWSLLNKMKVNTDKTFFLMTTNRTNVDFESGRIMLDGVPIRKEESSNFLGVVLDSKLKFNEHISHICSKISKCIGIMYRLRPILSFENLLSLYYAFVNPYLDYCILVWGTTYETYLYPLKILQKRVIRLICKEPYLSHTDPLFHKCSILKLDDMIKFRMGCYVFQNFDLFNNLGPFHSYNTRSSDSSYRLNPSYQRLTQTQHSVYFVAPRIWNEIPDYIKNVSTFTKFKRIYKNYLLAHYNAQS